MASSTGGKIVGTAERNDFYWFHSSAFGRNKVCLPFTWAKRTVHGLGKWRAKFRMGKFNRGSRIYHLYKSFPFTEKTVTKAWNWYQTWLWANGTKISVWNITSGKQDYLFRSSVAAGNFPLERPKRSCYIYFPTGYSGNVLWIVNKHELTLKFLQAPE